MGEMTEKVGLSKPRGLSFPQMFGVQPPQTLYHTRHSPRPKDRVHSTERPSHSRSEREAVLPANRNINQGSYLNKDGKRDRHRARSHSRSHSESMPLLDPVAGSSSGKRASAVYMHYRYSLNSLGDIIDRVSFYFYYNFIPFLGGGYDFRLLAACSHSGLLLG